VSLLSLEHVTKRYRHGRLERTAVKDVSLEVEPGEMVAVWGPRRSGRSTLLRLAGGLELPEEGTVRFEGRDLARSRDGVLGRRLGYCQMSFASGTPGLVVEHVAEGLFAQRVSQRDAFRRAEEVLVRVGAEHCGQLVCNELDGAEVARVAIASALVAAPALLVIDEPTSSVHQLERDPLLALLRSIANEGIAVLMSAGDAQSLGGVDRALSMDNGELRGELSASERVVPLRPVFDDPGEMESGTQQR
jgi:ABC-type ATPase involved in cell division